MSKREQLNSYIGQIEKRLRIGTLLRGAAILTSAALAATVVLVLIANAFAFSSGSMTGARILLLFAIALAVSFGLGIPLSRSSRRRAAGAAEGAMPEFQERLVTFAERDQNNRDPFIELLADDALDVARKADPSSIVPDRALLGSLLIGAASLAVLIYLVVAGPGFLGYGANLLWMGAHADTTPFYAINVTPGDATVRRHADQVVVAKTTGVQTDKVRLFARYQSSGKWDEVAMQPQPSGSGFQFLFAGLPEGVEYYVQAGAVRSRHFNIRVVDMPTVKQIRVTYHYPGWTGLQNVTEQHGGDLRAVEDTDANLEILMDRPLKDGVLVLENGQQVPLSGGEGNWYDGTVHIAKDGAYHVAGLDQGQPVRLSEDFFIEADKANPPTVRIARPGQDYRASPIEEVTVNVQADDPFGINDLKLHYSVNGGPDKTVDLLKKKGEKQADGSSTLALEDFKLVPGDLVSLYATANDARAQSRTDMMFVQVDPFEREFSQSQQAGGGGGGGGMGGGQDDIAQREKEIIASTWKQEGQKNAAAQQTAESAKFLAGVQSTLRNQALSLAGRLQKRDLTEENQAFDSFDQDMSSAAEAMTPAADRLQQEKWRDAIPNEEKALQYLLRAEATFRQIQVAFGNAGGGGGGGGAGRDLASLFDLELDTEKNQYETAQTGGSADQKQKDIDDALKKLDELARRQQELADQQRNNSADNFQQRWQQEMLRRDAEELQRQMEQMAQNGQQGQQGSSSSSSNSSSSSSSSSGQSGGQSASGQASSGQSNNGQQQTAGDDPRVQQALDRLRQANDDMRRAAADGQNPADARSAASRLREATNLLGGMHQQEANGQLDSMAREADQLANTERDQMQQMQKAFGNQPAGQNGQYGSASPYGNRYRQYYGGGGGQPQDQLANDRQKLADGLAKLQDQLRSQARDLAPTNRDAASKLRDALGNTEQSDLETRIQRSADWLRSGIDPRTNSNESEVAGDLQHLGDQIRQAQQSLGNGQPGPGQDNAVDRVERLRNEIQSLSRGAGRNGQNGQNSANGQNPQPGQLSRNGGQQGGNNGGNGPVGGFGPNGPNNAGGNYGNVYGGGNRNGQRGYQYGFDTGNNSNLPTPATPDSTPTPGDTERTIQQSVNDLNQLRDQVQDDPEAQREIQTLIQEMQRLDPTRFPGNPALIEQLHGQVLSDVDKLELQLSRKADSTQAGEVRSTDSMPVPSGYQDAVAEYFRRLSNKRQQ